MRRSAIDESPYAVIMAGGSGTRFWPRSREKRPKQLLNITGDEILLKKTIERIRPMIPASRIKIVATLSQADALKSAVPEIAEGNVIIEPVGKNTAPAIGVSALSVERDNPDAVMVILPADHHIEDKVRFRQRIMTGVRQAARGNQLVTIGIPPRGPETGYGYIEVDQLIDKDDGIYSVKSFHEKPDKETARAYINKGNYFWNSGIFIAKASRMLSEIAEYLPRTYTLLMKIRASLGTGEESAVMAEAYQHMEAVSIDYGVMERSSTVFMVAGDFGWDDVGSWSSAARYWPMDGDGNAFLGEVVSLDSSQCIIYSPKKLVALLGVEELVVVEEDDALLICRKGRSQDVRKLVQILRSGGREGLL